MDGGPAVVVSGSGGDESLCTELAFIFTAQGFARRGFVGATAPGDAVERSSATMLRFGDRGRRGLRVPLLARLGPLDDRMTRGNMRWFGEVYYHRLVRADEKRSSIDMRMNITRSYR
jgi:hypothetical protein